MSTTKELNKKVVLTAAQFESRRSAGTLQEGVEYEITDAVDDITDVRVNNTSIVTNHVATIPMAGTASDKVGLVKVYDAGYGIMIDNNSQLKINKGDWAKFNSVIPNGFLPVVTADLLLGMKKYLGSTIASTTSNTTWNDTEKANARNTLGCYTAVEYTGSESSYEDNTFYYTVD